ncbi:MAG: DegV family protein [Oscillospiraceae bacterium]
MIQIFTDTSANLPASYIQKYALRVIPLTYLIDGVEAHQDPTGDFDGKAYYDAMRSGTSVTTAMINIAGFLEPLREALAAGDDAIYIGMSGGISGTAHAASLAVEELKEEFPERKVASIDTYAASLGEGLLVVEAARMLENGASFDEIVEKISQRRHVMCQYFTVDDLAYLERGGRVSKAAAIVGTVLKIKPLLRGDEEGKIVLCGKTRGRKQSLASLADFYEKLVADKTEEIGIAHADDAECAQFLLDALRKRGFTGDCLTVCYEPVTGCHVGPGTVALFFYGVHR